MLVRVSTAGQPSGVLLRQELCLPRKPPELNQGTSQGIYSATQEDFRVQAVVQTDATAPRTTAHVLLFKRRIVYELAAEEMWHCCSRSEIVELRCHPAPFKSPPAAGISGDEVL
jgi:hypothetical protein